MEPWVHGWEQLATRPKKPDYLIEAQNRFEQVESEWLALTDIEPVPYEEAEMALRRLLQAESEYTAAKDRYYNERMTATFEIHKN